jgi:TPR repeat protein
MEWKGPQEAVRLFRLAAEQGHARAQALLGQMYEFRQILVTAPRQMVQIKPSMSAPLRLSTEWLFANRYPARVALTLSQPRRTSKRRDSVHAVQRYKASGMRGTRKISARLLEDAYIKDTPLGKPTALSEQNNGLARSRVPAPDVRKGRNARTVVSRAQRAGRPRALRSK